MLRRGAGITDAMEMCVRLEISQRRLNGAIYAKLIGDDGLVLVTGITTVTGLIGLVAMMLNRPIQ